MERPFAFMAQQSFTPGCFMLRTRDFIVLFVSYSTMAGGIFFPSLEPLLHDAPFYCVIILLFLSFLPLRVVDLLRVVRERPGSVAALVGLKNLLLPALVYIVAREVCPEYALGVLILSAISSAVLGPFFAGLVGADIALVVTVLVFSSLSVPVSLPFLISVMAGTQTSMDMGAMIRMLAMVILVPALAAEGVNRFAPEPGRGVMRFGFPISLACIMFTNLGVFSRYSAFFLANPEALPVALAIACVLGGVFLFVGGVLYRNRGVEEQLAAMISLGCLNNVLALVFCARFFGPTEASVIAMYSITLFLLIIPLQLTAGIRKRG